MIAIVPKNLSCLLLKNTSSPFVCRFPPLFLSTWTESQLGIAPTFFVTLTNNYDFPPDLASNVASDLSLHKTPEKAYSILSFLKESGFSNTQLVKIFKYRPRMLWCSLQRRIKPGIKTLEDVGFSSRDVCKVISSNPSILELNLKINLLTTLSVLKGLLGSDKEVARIVRKSPWLLTSNLHNTLVPNVELLKSYGVPMRRILIILVAFPRCFVIKPPFMRKCAEKVIEMGIDASSKNFIYAISAIAQMSSGSWELKLQAFRELGFSDKEILSMFRKAPRVLCASVKKLEMVKELLLGTGKFNMSSIVDFPYSFKYSIERRYTPRFRILGILESKNLIKEWPGLPTLCTLTDYMFFKKFISPYLHQLGDVCITEISAGRSMNQKQLLKPLE